MEKKKTRTIPTFVVPIAVLVLLSALSIPALASWGASYDYDGFPLTTKSSDTINGGVFISYGDNGKMENAKVKPYVTNYSVPSGTPKWAKLYMHLWGGTPHNSGTVNVTFNGHDFDTVVINGQETDDPQVLGSGCGTWWLFFNVTDKITPGAINKAEARVTSASMDGRVMRMVLIEAYEGGDDPQDLMYWVNDGHMNLHYNSSDYPTCIDYTKAWFNGTVPSGVTEANLTGVWLTGSYNEPDYFYFNPPDATDAPNGNNLNWDIGSYSDYQFGAYDIGTGLMSYADVAMGGGWYPSYFDIHSNTTTNTSTLADVLKTDNNYAISWRGHDDNGDGWIYGAFGDTTGAEGEGYVHPVIAVLVLSLETGPGTEPDLAVDGINAFHYDSDQKAWFNLTNEVNVTVNNTGDADAGAFDVSLYANDEFIAKQSVLGLPSGNTATLQFLWTPIGCDCDDDCSPEDYTLKAVADCDNSVAESNENNNESTTVERVYWTGYMADEPLEHIIHGTIEGGLYYTTGDGLYSMLYGPGYSAETDYEITLPGDADVALARLNVYYTWQKGTSKYPEMKVEITNTSGTYEVPLDESYNDSPCTGLAFTYPFGNYVYDVAPYITGSGSYTVKVENAGTIGAQGPTSNFCIAAPGIVILYEDSTKPEYEYWLIEGADLLEGGRRSGAGSLSLAECTRNATFTGNIDTGGLETATLGMVSAWGGAAWGDWTSEYWFNNNYLGNGSIMGGYGSLYDRTVDGISMFVGDSGDAQMGANVSDVTAYIAGSDNTVSFGDDGDSMMATNAFLMVKYEGGAPGIADHVVISEVQIQGDGNPKHDFVEIYNPTDTAVDLSGYNLMKMTSTGTSSSIKSPIDTYTLPPHRFYLWASSSDSNYPTAIGADVSTTATIASDNAVAIVRRSDDEVISGVGWGDIDPVTVTYCENAPYSDNPGNDESLQRKINATIDGDSYGPAWDTNDNSADFFTQTTPSPQNSASGPLPPIPELNTLVLLTTGLVALMGYAIVKKGRKG